MLFRSVTSLSGRRGALVIRAAGHRERPCATLKVFPRCRRKQQSGGGSWLVAAAGRTMSGRKPRSVANPLESAITTPSERILKECHSLYVDTENGK